MSVIFVKMTWKGGLSISKKGVRRLHDRNDRHLRRRRILMNWTLFLWTCAMCSYERVLMNVFLWTCSYERVYVCSYERVYVLINVFMCVLMISVLGSFLDFWVLVPYMKKWVLVSYILNWDWFIILENIFWLYKNHKCYIFNFQFIYVSFYKLQNKIEMDIRMYLYSISNQQIKIEIYLTDRTEDISTRNNAIWNTKHLTGGIRQGGGICGNDWRSGSPSTSMRTELSCCENAWLRNLPEKSWTNRI